MAGFCLLYWFPLISSIRWFDYSQQAFFCTHLNLKPKMFLNFSLFILKNIVLYKEAYPTYFSKYIIGQLPCLTRIMDNLLLQYFCTNHFYQIQDIFSESTKVWKQQSFFKTELVCKRLILLCIKSFIDSLICYSNNKKCVSDDLLGF